MKNSKLVSVNLTTLMGLMAILLIGVIAIFASIIIYSDYKFNESSNERSENVLANSLLTGSMPLAVATQDIEMIKSLVHGHLKFDEIFAIEINSTDGCFFSGALSRGQKSLLNAFLSLFGLKSKPVIGHPSQAPNRL